MPNFRDLALTSLRVGVTVALVAVAAFAGWRLWTHYQRDPWTRDGRVRVDIAEIAPDVSGLVTEVRVVNDQRVKRGDVLFVIDRERYALALRQAETAIATQQAAIAVQKTAILVHRASLTEARREAARNDGLGGLVAREQIEQSHARVDQDEATVAQAEAAVTQAEAALAQAEAARDVAGLNLARTEITAPADGMLSDMTLQVGDYVTPGKPVLALIETATLRVEGYFEETKLPRLHVGQAADVLLMGESEPLRGHVQSIAGAIEDRERGPSPFMLPNVNPTFSWVRLAQRIPVRIALDKVPPSIRLIAGRTASVTLLDQPAAVK